MQILRFILCVFHFAESSDKTIIIIIVCVVVGVGIIVGIVVAVIICNRKKKPEIEGNVPRVKVCRIQRNC